MVCGKEQAGRKVPLFSRPNYMSAYIYSGEPFNSSERNPEKVTSEKEITMPVYEFKCQKCEHNFSLIMTIAEYEKKKFTCPKCKSDKLKRQLSSFQTITSKKS